VIRGLALNNEIRNISGDFIRPNGSEVLIQGNKAYDGYVSQEDGDGNHDDFIQGFALNGVPYVNVHIIDNFFQDYTLPNRKYIGYYQGISVFDGEYNNYVVRGNTVIGGAYHGISFYGGNNGLIENNTVVSSYPGFARKFWIYAPPTKAGVPASNITIRNNFTNSIPATTSDVTLSNNAIVPASSVADHMVKYDIPNAQYDLHLKSTSIYYGKNIGDQTPQ
jgi:parallel beta-helix repeat protein